MYTEKLISKFPFLSEMDDEEFSHFFDKISYKRLQNQELMLLRDDICEGAPIVIEGSLRLFHISEKGREMNIYNVNEGEICILAAICMLDNRPFDISIQAQSETIIGVINPILFFRLLEGNSKFSRYIMNAMADKLIKSVDLLYDVNFYRIEERILKYLNENIKNNELRITHENLAIELATSREVVSKELKKLENKGILNLSRGKIMLNL